MSHTLGPWRAGSLPNNTGGVSVMGSDGERLAVVDDCAEASVRIYHEPRPNEEAQANLRLIIAAPDLLATLSAILNGEFAHYIPSVLFDPARAAVARAQGDA